MTSSRLERSAKLTAAISAVTALLFIAYLSGTVAWAAVVFLGSFGTGRLSPDRARAGVLGALYVFPVVCLVLVGEFNHGGDAMWQLALLGVVLSAPQATEWSMPRLWAVALGTWALTVALCWPVVILRELDFSPSLLARGEFSQAIISWAPLVAATHITGVLWLDSLFSTFDRRSERFDRVVVLPLAVGITLGGLLAAYQYFVDVAFLNPTVYASYHRVAGGMLDGNVYGMLAALWIAGLIVPMTSAGTSVRARRLLGAGVVISAVGCWASGSRTALLGAVVVVLFVAVAETRRVGRLVYVPVGAGVLVLAGAWVARRYAETGTLARIANLVPAMSEHPFRAVLLELWNRNWYGAVADWAIAHSPIVGIGVGSFNTLAPQVADLIGHGPLPPDNAQNWFRHQLAEFGILGSLGWMVGGVLILRLLFQGRTSPSTAAMRGALVGLGVASLVGMPTQSVAVLLTFWTFVFWCGQLSATESRRALPPDALGPRLTAMWRTGWLAAAACAVLTAYLGWTAWRPPLRALRFDRDYDYGFYGPETDAAGHEYQWAGRHALVVLPVSQPWLKVTFSVNHRDLQAHPVDVTITKDGKNSIAVVLADSRPVTAYLAAPNGHKRIMLETTVNRTVRPSDFGSTDSRELGLMVSWEFVDRRDPAVQLMAAR